MVVEVIRAEKMKSNDMGWLRGGSISKFVK